MVHYYVNYNQIVGEGSTIIKREKQMNAIKPQIIDKRVPMKQAKLKNLSTLLSKDFTPTWKEMDNLAFSVADHL